MLRCHFCCCPPRRELSEPPKAGMNISSSNHQIDTSLNRNIPESPRTKPLVFFEHTHNFSTSTNARRRYQTTCCTNPLCVTSRCGTLCQAKVLPGRKSGFRAGFRLDSNRENLKSCPPAGLRPAGGPISRLSVLDSGRNQDRKPYFRPGSTIVQHNDPNHINLYGLVTCMAPSPINL